MPAPPFGHTDVLTCQRERMRALLLLCVFAHASVWGNPEQPQGTIPKGERRGHSCSRGKNSNNSNNVCPVGENEVTSTRVLCVLQIPSIMLDVRLSALRHVWTHQPGSQARGRQRKEFVCFTPPSVFDCVRGQGFLGAPMERRICARERLHEHPQ